MYTHSVSTGMRRTCAAATKRCDTRADHAAAAAAEEAGAAAVAAVGAAQGRRGRGSGRRRRQRRRLPPRPQPDPPAQPCAPGVSQWRLPFSDFT